MVQETYVRHLLSDVSDTIETTQAVKWVHQSSDEADSIRLPAGIVDPGPENKFGRLVRRSTSHNRDENDQPADLQVEERESIKTGNYLVAEQYDRCCDEVKTLIDDEGLPSLKFDVWMVQKDQSRKGLGIDEIGRCRRKDPYERVNRRIRRRSRWSNVHPHTVNQPVTKLNTAL
jgi:hypothetical protein